MSRVIHTTHYNMPWDEMNHVRPGRHNAIVRVTLQNQMVANWLQHEREVGEHGATVELVYCIKISNAQ